MSGLVWLGACGQDDSTRVGPGNAGQGGSAAQTPGFEVLYEGEASPYAIALDDRYLYWASGAGLRRAPFDGGEVVTLAPLDAVEALLPAGEYVYFRLGSSDVRGEVGRVPRDGGELAWLVDDPDVRGLAVGTSHVYWSVLTGNATAAGSVWRANLDGSAPTRLASELVSPRMLAVDDGDRLVFAHGIASCTNPEALECATPGLSAVSSGGAEPELVVATLAGANPVFHEGAMYWLAGEPRGSELWMLPDGGAASAVMRLYLDSPSNGTELVADAAALYWTVEGRVVRLPFDNPEVQPLASGLEGAGRIAVGGGRVYVPDRERGRILRIPTDGSAYRPASEAITGPCPAPLGSLEEFALTPRADPNLELLALELEPDRLVASQATYDRLAADVAVIRARVPALAEVTYLAPHDGRSIQLQLTPSAQQAVGEGQYGAWDCLNTAYGVSNFSRYGLSVDLELDGTYDLPQLLEGYRQLPGVTSGYAGSGGLDGPTICVARTGERYDYVFDDTGSFCPEPCRQHHAYQFSSEAAGQVTSLAEWDSESGAPVPDWFGAVCAFEPRVGGP